MVLRSELLRSREMVSFLAMPTSGTSIVLWVPTGLLSAMGLAPADENTFLNSLETMPLDTSSMPSGGSAPAAATQTSLPFLSTPLTAWPCGHAPWSALMPVSLLPSPAKDVALMVPAVTAGETSFLALSA